MEEKKKQLVQQVIDRLLYCNGYVEELSKLNSHYDPHSVVKFTNEVKKFKLSILN